MKIIVYGTGCKSCKKLYNNVLKAIEEKSIDAEVIYETNINIIINKGIMQTPALEIDSKIVSMGKVLKEKDIIAFLK